LNKKSIKTIYNNLLFLQVIFAFISPLLLWFFGIDLLFALKVMKMNPFSLPLEIWSIIVTGYELFCSVFLAKIVVLFISFIIFKSREHKSARY
jgi:hypothetical protein